jgi:DNA-binding IclR family transcriptional regulator
VAEAASLVGLNRSTVSRYFGSLVLAGVLERSREEQAAYEPGPLLLQLGAVAQGQRRVLDLAPRHMRRLSRETGLTVVLSLWGSAGPVVSLVSEVGTGPILHFSKDREAVAKYWGSLDPVRRRRVEAEVADAGKRGLSTVSAPVGMAVLAAPVFDDHGIAATIAAVGGQPDDAEIATALRRAAFRITAEMGGTEVWRSLMPGGTEDVAESVEAS